MTIHQDWQTRVHSDIGFLVRARLATEVVVDFEIFETLNHATDTGPVILERTGSIGPLENPTSNPDEAEWFARGHVKWDGCSNTVFNTETCMHHACDRQSMKNVGVVFDRLFDLATEMMPMNAHHLK